MRTRGRFNPIRLAAALLLCSLLSTGIGIDAGTKPVQSTGTLPDLSGLAWVDGDAFLAVHDAKNPEENDRPRVSMVWLPRAGDTVSWKPLSLDWPAPLGLSGDLESVARIPGTRLFLLAESGENRLNDQRFRRVFMAELNGERAAIRAFTELPATIKNIEGSAVARLGERLIFVCGERADGRAAAEVFWSDLQLEPFRLGPFRQAYFRPASFTGPNWRPISAIEIDNRGRIYIASAYDPESDDGPFTSIIRHAGQVAVDRNNNVRLNLLGRPRQVARLDGLKVESLAMREAGRAAPELFAGTDDENYGGALRLIGGQR
jgi:hypothetical protein